MNEKRTVTRRAVLAASAGLASYGATSVNAEMTDEGKEILLPTRSGDPMKFTGEAYLKHFVLPNLYFHATTTYALLRHAGVELGKKDFLGAA